MKFHWRIGLALFSVVVVASAGRQALAHCQIPCGIYDDPARFTALEEHVTTIEKSMKLINELSAEGTKNYNQIVRWVNNKEAHADEFTEIVTFYFLAQRIKPVDPSDKEAVSKYLRELKMLHEMIVFAMKCKQTTDVENCAKLRALIKGFKASYMGGQANATATHRHLASDHDHDHDHGHQHP
jgi:nickel superoxide dismutase